VKERYFDHYFTMRYYVKEYLHTSKQQIYSKIRVLVDEKTCNKND